MSLEEFLGDDSLGDSVWNEDDINIDAINNTINIEVLKNSHQKSNITNNSIRGNQPQIHQNIVSPQYPVNSTVLPFASTSVSSPTSTTINSTSLSSSSFNQNDYYKKQNPQLRNVPDSYANNQQQFTVQGPPYMIKFSNLPPRFADSDIEELFEAKYTKFVKFKIFWEINKNPSLSTLKSGSIFDQNFKRDAKVAFVEVYSARDIMKILKYWYQPLKEIYKIHTEPAQYEDFKEYMSKINLLTDPSDDPSKPYLVPKNKTNPFGTAKPVDTQSKILDIEEKMERLHVEDTETLRRLSEGEPLESLKPKITILKKPQLSYSEVAQQSLLDSIKKNSPQNAGSGKVLDSSSNSLATSNPSNNESNSENVSNSHEIKQGNESKENSSEYNNNVTMSETYENYDLSEDRTKNKLYENIEGESSKIFTFKNQERDMSPSGNNLQNYNKSYRGGRGIGLRGRGGRGGRGGNFSRGYNNRGRGGYNQRFNNNFDNSRNTSYRKQTFEEKDGGPSLFAPASGFLQTTTKNDRGGHHSNSRGRGGYYRSNSNYSGSYI
ncbi:hypothetical protein RI543_003064 [Arxiozyma heterogenica]|uniref:RRM domain-containing protein n=1 Tax=Arxiozyma heterogenica TaxID=278026 RepID=A0AAN7WLX8_9SACH|nr:hypothetical protein RI543_003064 [Kazachstania heterogenica]